MSSIPDDIEAGAKVEVTHHVTRLSEWFPATVTKVTAKFVDVLRDDWTASKPVRYRRRDGREVSGYCGFYSHVRPIASDPAAQPDDDDPTERACRHGTRLIDDPCEVCDAE